MVIKMPNERFLSACETAVISISLTSTLLSPARPAEVCFTVLKLARKVAENGRGSSEVLWLVGRSGESVLGPLPRWWGVISQRSSSITGDHS